MKLIVLTAGLAIVCLTVSIKEANSNDQRTARVAVRQLKPGHLKSAARREPSARAAAIPSTSLSANHVKQIFASLDLPQPKQYKAVHTLTARRTYFESPEFTPYTWKGLVSPKGVMINTSGGLDINCTVNEFRVPKGTMFTIWLPVFKGHCILRYYLRYDDLTGGDVVWTTSKEVIEKPLILDWSKPIPTTPTQYAESISQGHNVGVIVLSSSGGLPSSIGMIGESDVIVTKVEITNHM